MLRPYQLERNEEGKAFPYSNAVAERPAQRGQLPLPLLNVCARGALKHHYLPVRRCGSFHLDLHSPRVKPGSGAQQWLSITLLLAFPSSVPSLAHKLCHGSRFGSGGNPPAAASHSPRILVDLHSMFAHAPRQLNPRATSPSLSQPRTFISSPCPS